MAKKKNEKDIHLYKTEDQIKSETQIRIEQERLIEQSRKPKSETEKKIENFLYHYKNLTIGLVFAVIIVVFFAKDIFFSEKPDITIVMATSQFYPSEILQGLEVELEKYASDVNGDGKVVVQIDHIPFDPQPFSTDEQESAVSGSSQAQPLAAEAVAGMTQDDYAYIMKLMATIAAAGEQIYILDEPNYIYISNMSDEGEYSIFLDLSSISGAQGSALPLLNTKLSVLPEAQYLKNISIYMRNLNVTDKNAAELAANEELIKKIA